MVNSQHVADQTSTTSAGQAPLRDLPITNNFQKVGAAANQAQGKNLQDEMRAHIEHQMEGVEVQEEMS